MADYIHKIASLITEDPDVFSPYQKAWKKGSALDLADYHKVVGALKEVARRNDCELDESRLTVELIPPGFIIKNIFLDCGDPRKKLQLAQRLADASGDDDIRHSFDENLRINLYNAINKEFAELVRDQFNLEVTHQAMDVGPDSEIDRAEILPMCTIIAPSASVRPDESELPPDLGAPESDLGLPPPPPGTPESGELTEPFPGEGETPAEKEMIEFEHVGRIANMITEDPDLIL